MWGLTTCIICFLVVVSGVRIGEEERERHVRDHHHHSPRSETKSDGHADGDSQDHAIGGIQVVEDDVPEWVKLTFADKFIVMGESAFVEIGEGSDDVDKPEDEKENSGYEDEQWGHIVHHAGDEASDEYEYFYSDEEGFEFDPNRDKIVYDPHQDPHGHTRRHHHGSTNAEPRKEPEVSEESDDPFDDVKLIEAVKQHRAEVDRTGSPVASVPLNADASSAQKAAGGAPVPRPTGLKEEIEKGLPGTISMLSISDTVVKGKSHLPGTRRANRQAAKERPRRLQDTHLHAIDLNTRFGHVFKENSRYSSGGGRVDLNPNDPRIKAFSESVVNFLEDTPVPLKLVHDGSDTTAKNHREWLAKHDDGEVKLPSLKRIMYSNGMPVADWEVGYVADVLQQYGY